MLADVEEGGLLLKLTNQQPSDHRFYSIAEEMIDWIRGPAWGKNTQGHVGRENQPSSV